MVSIPNTGNPRMTSELTGQVEHITFINPDNGFTIAKVKVGGRPDLVTVLGNLMSPSPGEILQMTGEWTRHPKYGEQFKVDSYRTRVPATVHGIRKYLGSGMIKGLGPVMADRIVDKFGDQTLDVIENNIHRLAEVEGIGAKRIAMVAEAWAGQREIREIMIFLQSHGVGSGYAAKIFRQYGQRSVAVVKENPYRLAGDIFGIGFLTADRIAQKLGFPADAPMRVEAGVLYVLRRLGDEGNVYFPYSDLIEKCRDVLNVEQAAISAGIESLSRKREIVIEALPEGRQAVYPAQFHVCETGISDRLRFLHAVPKSIRSIRSDQALEWVQQRLTIRLAANQVRALRAAIQEKTLVITGGPGTGKTTIIRAVLMIFSRLGAHALLAAPTGRAAKRLSETCDRQASTIHRLLEFSPAKGGFQRDEQNTLECDLLVIDEASMIDTVLMYHLLKAVPATATLILVGDVNQLPSVGAGNVLGDIIDAGTITTVALNEIFRQARQSRIIVNAHRINSGLIPEGTSPASDPPPGSDFYFIQQEDPEKVLATIIELTRERIPGRFGLDPMNDVQVLTPMHRGIVGSANLNQQLQAALNPGPDGLVRGDRRFRLHDRVMQIRNNYDKDVFNGDVGRILRIDEAVQEVAVLYDEREVVYDYVDLDEIVLAYAISVHKSQGSEYPAVVMPVLTQHFILLQRNLIYTAVTRGRQLVVLVGTRKALAIAVNNDKTQMRYTRLRERLQILG
jgi:exodeoxyribonuclease V alpha subunit